MCVDELAIAGRETVVNDNIRPRSKTPESKVEDASILVIKILFFVVRNNLQIEPRIGTYNSHAFIK